MKFAAKPRHRYQEVQGLRVHYREAGTPSPTAVVLLHGSPSSSYSFRNVLPVLGETTYVVAPDLLGFGFSDAPGVDEYEYTFDNLSQVVDALLDDLGVEKYVLYVTDFSTPVGYYMATRHPESVHDQLFHDYRKHVARFGEIAEYHAAYQPACLVLWGRHDVFFDIAEVLAYHDELTTFDAHIYDAGHFLLETHSAEVTDLLVTFVDDVFTRATASTGG